MSRLWHLGRAAGNLASGVGVRGLIDLAAGGERIRLGPAAARRVAPDLVERYRRLARAVLAGDGAAILDASRALGFISAIASPAQRKGFLGLVEIGAEPVRIQGRYEFGSSDLMERLRRVGRTLFQQDA